MAILSNSKFRNQDNRVTLFASSILSSLSIKIVRFEHLYLFLLDRYLFIRTLIFSPRLVGEVPFDICYDYFRQFFPLYNFANSFMDVFFIEYLYLVQRFVYHKKINVFNVNRLLVMAKNDEDIRSIDVGEIILLLIIHTIILLFRYIFVDLLQP